VATLLGYNPTPIPFYDKLFAEPPYRDDESAPTETRAEP
jgi:hypothetical protein